MPKIQWTDLPPVLREHLFDRVRERKTDAEDLWRLKVWRESEPDAHDGPWFKDFGSFKVCGEGEEPLIRSRPLYGRGPWTLVATHEALAPVEIDLGSPGLTPSDVLPVHRIALRAAVAPAPGAGR